MLKKNNNKGFYDASANVSLHDKIELDNLFRNLGSLGGKRNLVKYVSNTLGCPAFVIDESSKLFATYGYSSYVKRKDIFGEELYSLLTFLDHPAYIQKVLLDNFTLYPLYFCFDFELEGKVASSLCVVAVNLDENLTFGVVGKTDINFDLVVPVLKYILEKTN